MNRFIQETIEYRSARLSRADRWVPACGGFETPFRYRNQKILYVYNHATGKHGYLDMRQDIVFGDLELTKVV